MPGKPSTVVAGEAEGWDDVPEAVADVVAGSEDRLLAATDVAKVAGVQPVSRAAMPPITATASLVRTVAPPVGHSMAGASLRAGPERHRRHAQGRASAIAPSQRVPSGTSRSCVAGE